MSPVFPLLRRHNSTAEIKSATHATSSDTIRQLDVNPAVNATKPENNGIIEAPSIFKIRRKPAPAIAARFKALGFGGDSSKKVAQDSEVGRIPEDQIKSIDLLHRANSNSTPFIQRLGRTWSSQTVSAPGTPQLAGSPRSVSANTPQLVGSGDNGFIVIESTIDRTKALNAALATPPIQSTPTIEESKEDPSEAAESEPVTPAVEVTDMGVLYRAQDLDEQKYRLPEHVNGNGTKAMPQTKVAYFERMDEPPPPPPPKDSPPMRPLSKDRPMSGDSTTDSDSYFPQFNPFGRPRAGSIITISKESFVNHLAQLTSLQLPDGETLRTKVAALPTSGTAMVALKSAKSQIMSWISKAYEVLQDLHADDDGEDGIEWAAAGGREGGYKEIDKVIARFDLLICVYYDAAEDLKHRDDSTTDDINYARKQVDDIAYEWKVIEGGLAHIKEQVRVAQEWEDIWTKTLGPIGDEVEILKTLVFEMEETRHRSLPAETGGDLQMIVEESPSAAKNNRFSITSAFPTLHQASPILSIDDSSLLALDARMTPLKVSIEVLPARLYSFKDSAGHIFFNACDELMSHYEQLERSWKELEHNADALRKELGEDVWLSVFRNAGSQANKMLDSVKRSLMKVREAIDGGQQYISMAAVSQKVESYESKKIHYSPSIDKVLGIIETGVQDRRTVNGEIIRLHADMQGRWEILKEEMYDLDQLIQVLHNDRQLRDSVSSLATNDRSTSFSSANETPGSSPASSIIMSNLNHGTDPRTPGKRSTSHPSGGPEARRTPMNNNTIPRKPRLPGRSSGYGQQTAVSPMSHPGRQSTTPTGNRITRPSFSANSNTSTLSRPRFSAVVRPDAGSVSSIHKPLPSPNPVTSRSVSRLGGVAGGNRSFSDHALTPLTSKIPLRKSMGGSSVSPASPTSPLASDAQRERERGTTPLPNRPKLGAGGNLSFRDRMASNPGPYAQQNLLSPSRKTLQTQRSSSNLGVTNRGQSIQPGMSPGALILQPQRTPNRRSSMQLTDTVYADVMDSSSRLAATPRAASSMGGRRSSLLPLPKTPQPKPRAVSRTQMQGVDSGRRDSSVSGCESRAAVQGAARAMNGRESGFGMRSDVSQGKQAEKPKRK